MKKSHLQLITGLGVLLAWFLALAVGLQKQDYEGLQLVTPVMLIYAGYLFGDAYFRNVKKNGDE